MIFLERTSGLKRVAEQLLPDEGGIRFENQWGISLMTDITTLPITPRASIRSLTFSDGKTIDLSGDDIVVLVGPNNAGVVFHITLTDFF